MPTSSLAVTTPPNLIVGCGYLGQRVAARWLALGQSVAALTRRNARALMAMGIEPFVGDVLDSASLRRLPAAATVLYAVGRDRSSGKSVREVAVTGLGHVLDTLPSCERFIYVSSTGVYAQTTGDLVDETSPTEPVEETAVAAREAELLLRTRRPDSIILRFAGIYGPNRLMGKQPLLAGQPIRGDTNRWLNLIHVDDGSAAILTTESRGKPGETYNVVDDEPTPRRIFYLHLAELLAVSAPTFDDHPEPGQPHRRVSNAKAKCELGWQPRYPSYRDGLPVAIRESVA